MRWPDREIQARDRGWTRAVGGEDDISCGFAFLPVTTASLSPDALNGWFRNPTADADRDRSGRRSRSHRVSSRLVRKMDDVRGPFQVAGDGLHTLEYRSIDRLGHVEPAKSLAFKIDATVPVIGGSRRPARSGRRTTRWFRSPPSPLPMRSPDSRERRRSRFRATRLLDAADVQVSGGIVNVRAFRLGTGDGRRYEIRAEAVDLAGNTTTGVATCVVPRDQGGAEATVEVAPAARCTVVSVEPFRGLKSIRDVVHQGIGWQGRRRNVLRAAANQRRFFGCGFAAAMRIDCRAHSASSGADSNTLIGTS